MQVTEVAIQFGGNLTHPMGVGDDPVSEMSDVQLGLSLPSQHAKQTTLITTTTGQGQSPVTSGLGRVETGRSQACWRAAEPKQAPGSVKIKIHQDQKGADNETLDQG